ncbi:MAG: biotin/lipoyl-binding protein [Saprospiraceae bacterium]|nr:biotin/lipoyl-binding protein [Saprospiraceae bacterium]
MTLKKKKKNRRRWLLWALLAIAILLVAGYVYNSNKAPEGEPVDFATVENRTIKERVSASGRVYPEKEVKISSDVSGEIVQLLVEEGDSVYQGQLLVKIDPEAYLSAVEQGEANLNNARAQTANSRSQIENSIAQKEQLTAQLKQAELLHDRNIKLKSDGVISDSEFEETLTNIESLKANIRASEASIRSAQESAKAAEFTVKSATAQVKELRTNLSRTAIKAPTAGIITSLAVEEGERVVGTAQMAGTEMMRVSNLNVMEVQVEVSENDILKVELSDVVEVEVDAYIDRKFEGYVSEIANSAANSASATGSLNTDQVTNFIVKIIIKPSSYDDIISDINPYPFRPGMSASVDIITDIKENIIAAPIQAIAVRKKDKDDKSNDEMDEVVFSTDSDTAIMHVVTTGIQDDDFIEILSGLKTGEEIISGPYSTVSRTLETGTLVKKKEDKGEEGDKT